MKRTFFVIVGLVVAFFILSPKLPPASSPVIEAPKSEISKPITVSIYNGVATISASAIGISTVFDGLGVATASAHLTTRVKHYDFGVFVVQIGDLSNTNDKSWIYFLNGKAGTQAADKQTVRSGDSIEWKYIKPSFE